MNIDTIARDKAFNTRQMPKFSPEAYDCFADSDGKISRDRFIDVVSTCDCFLSHDWYTPITPCTIALTYGLLLYTYIHTYIHTYIQ